jgi:hypothetical protein
MTNPAVARKTPDHANSPNAAVISMTYFPERKKICSKQHTAEE